MKGWEGIVFSTTKHQQISFFTKCALWQMLKMSWSELGIVKPTAYVLSLIKLFDLLWKRIILPALPQWFIDSGVFMTSNYKLGVGSSYNTNFDQYFFAQMLWRHFSLLFEAKFHVQGDPEKTLFSDLCSSGPNLTLQDDPQGWISVKHPFLVN